jgi:sarcosine oxidase
VLLVDRHGTGHQLGSSSGPTRLWRVTHPDRTRVRLALRSVEAWQRLEAASGIRVLLRRGLLWRDDVSVPGVLEALTAEDVEFAVVDPGDVGRFFPGLRPDGRPAVWQETAGPVLAREAIDAQVGLLAMARGRILIGPVIRDIDVRGDDVVVHAEDGRTFDADVVVLAPGPGAGPLLARLGVELALRPVLEQVCHVGRGSDTDGLPCLYDGPSGDEPGMYAMPTPGRGYKLGIDRPLRDWDEDDRDRVPDPGVSEAISARVVRSFEGLDPTVLDAQVCSWTDSPDGRFVIDTLADGRVVVACGDSGEGFKFSALMGIVLADLAEGHPVDADVATFGLARFDGGAPASASTHVLGR